MLRTGDAEINQKVPALRGISKSSEQERQVKKLFRMAIVHIVYEIRLPTWSSGSQVL